MSQCQAFGGQVFVTRTFNPLGLLQQLLLTHGDKLEHLSLLINDHGGNSLLLQNFAVVHLKRLQYV